MIYLAGPYTANMVNEQYHNIGRLFTFFMHLHMTKPGIPVVCYPLQTTYFEHVDAIPGDSYLDACCALIMHCPLDVVFVPNWEYSYGAVKEHECAKQNNRRIVELYRFYLDERKLITEMRKLQPYNKFADAGITYLASDLI